MECLCGSTNFVSSSHFYYEISETGKTTLSDESMMVERCEKCGAFHQSSFSELWEEDGYKKFYQEYPPVSPKYSVKDRKHDKEVATQRANFYEVLPGSPDLQVLDIGCGSGAFVEECLDRGVKAYGCELANYNSSFDRNIYRARFEDIHFPTDSFSIVTCHDVLEHVSSPTSFFQEIFRVTSQEGTAWIEIPNFFCVDGAKHWKKEHLWFFCADDVIKLGERVGFSFQSLSSPIVGKLLFQFRKPEQKRITILVPPGIGDSYWSIVKMEGMMKEKGIALPSVSVVCPRSKKHNGHMRAFPFLEMFPFVHASWDVVDNQDAAHKTIWREAYSQEGRTLFKNVLGNDYFLSYNGHLRVGKELADIDPKWECNWFPPMFVSLDQTSFQTYAQARFGKYIVFYFIFQGTYCYWTSQFSLDKVAKSVVSICEETGCVPVFVGGKWDAADNSLSQVMRNVPNAINLVGKTSLQQVFGLIKGAQMVVGYPSGLTIMSAALKQKTMVIWNDYYNRDFFQNAMPPAVRGKTYFAEHTFELTPNILRKECGEILAGKELKQRELPEPVLTPPNPSPIPTMGQGKISPYMGSKAASTAVICVLKSGGDYTQEYVEKLFASIKRNLHESPEMEYICLTDLPIKTSDFTVKPLLHNYPGWWSKVEVFRPGLTKAELCVYFDLDTIILRDISDILTVKGGKTFSALYPWNMKNRSNGDFASGIMRWKNPLYSFLYSDFSESMQQEFPGDQQYFSAQMKKRGFPWLPLQSFFPGIYSYKRNIRGENLLGDSRVVCFHGNPRPHALNYRWIKENWRK